MPEHDAHPSPEQQPAASGMLAEIEQDSYSRARFLKLAGGVGAVGAMSALLAACGSDSGSGGSSGTTRETDREEEEDTSTTTTTTSASGDLEIVNYALTLEYIEADFYRAVIDSGLFKGKELDLIKTFGEHEQTHVEALESTAKTLGEPAAKPETTFPLEDRMSVLNLAATVENLGAAAYLGQAARIEDSEILAAALAIHTVEARHAAALNQLIGENFVPDGAFAKPASMEEVLPKVKPFLVA